MREMKKLLIGLAISIGLVGIVHAIDTSVATYKPGRGGSYRSAIAVVDSAALDGASNLALPYIDVGFNQVVRVDLKMSVSAATCGIQFVRSNDELFRGRPSVTSSSAAASATRTFAGRYVADSIAFDTGSYRYCKILVDAPSSGNVDIDYIICGSN